MKRVVVKESVRGRFHWKLMDGAKTVANGCGSFDTRADARAAGENVLPQPTPPVSAWPTRLIWLGIGIFTGALMAGFDM